MAKRKNRAAVQLGRRGGYARAQRLSKAQLSEIGRKAINARWAKYRKEKENK